jgi:hypothetical protein
MVISPLQQASMTRPAIVEIAIEQVDLAAIDLEPRAADDPWSPAADRRHLGRLRMMDQRSHRPQQAIRIERLHRREIEADVVVRRCVRSAART